MPGTMESRTVIPFGPFEADLASQELRKHGVRLRLPRQSFQILKMLLERPGQLVSREDMRAALWPSDTFVDFEHSLNAAINKLREALGDDADNPTFIETLPKRGYRFIAANAPQAASSGSIHLPEPAPPAPSQSSPPRRSALKVAAALLIALTVAIVILAATGLGKKLWYHPTPPPQIHSLAVLPLVNLSGDPAQEYLADGITEELILGLSRLSGLKVISRTSVVQYKGERKKTLSQIGRELNVDAVLEGSVLRSSNRVHIQVHMVHAPTEQTLMTQTFDRDLEDVLKLQGDVAAAITKQMGLRLRAEQYVGLYPARRVNSEAMEMYLKAWELDWTVQQQNKQAQDYLRQAIGKDPNCAELYTALASTQVQLGEHRWVPPEEAYGPARQLLRRALELDDKNCWAHRRLAELDWRYEWNWKDAEKEGRSAIQVCPNDELGHGWLAYFSAWAGRKDEALAEISKARELDPTFSEPLNLEAMVNYHLRNYKGLAEVCRKYVISEPDHWLPYYWLGVGLEGSGQTVEAIPQYQKSVELSQNDSDAVAALAYAYATAGKRTEAQKILDDFLHQSETSYVSPYMIAVIYAGLGNKDKAFEYLEKAYQERSFDLPWFLPADLRMDTLRSDPRFQDLMRRMKFPQ